MGLAKFMANDQNPCLSRKVGVVVVDPNTNGIVGAGYNGPPEGTPHCTEQSFLQKFFWPQLNRQEQTTLRAQYNNSINAMCDEEAGSEDICQFISTCNQCPRNILGYSSGKRSELCSCQHAERNALNKLPIPANGLVMFCWCGIPCIQCTGSIINAGILEVHCLKEKDYQSASRWLFEHGKTKLIEHDASLLV